MSEFFEAIKLSSWPHSQYYRHSPINFLEKPIEFVENITTERFLTYRLSLNWNAEVNICEINNHENERTRLRNECIKMFKEKCYGHIYNQLYELKLMIEYKKDEDAIKKINEIISEVMK